MDARTRTGVIMALLAAAGYAFFPVFTKLIYQYSEFDALDIAGWRFGISVPLFWGLLALRDRTIGNPHPEEHLPRWALLGLGFLLATGALAAFYGLSLIATGVYVMLFRTYPAMVLVFSALLGERLPERGWLALLLVMLGVGLMVVNPGEVSVAVTMTYLIGVGVAFYNAAVIAVYNILQGKVIAGRASKARASAWTLTGSLLTVLPLLAIFGLAALPNWQTFFSLVGLSILCTVLPIIAIFEGIQRIGASRFVLIGSVEPLLALLLAFLLFGEVLSPAQLAGGLLILASIVVLEVRLPGERRRRAASAESGS